MTPKLQILSIANQKGGVGKTTTTMNVGAALAKLGARVLLVDNDPQANLTRYLGVDEPARTIDELYLSKRPLSQATLQEWLQPTDEGVSLIAGDRSLSGVEYALMTRPDRERILGRALQTLENQFDYILIDNAPSLNLLTLNAFVASHSILIPVHLEFFSLEGIVKIKETLEDIQSRYNPNLKILGVLPSQVRARRKLSSEVKQLLLEHLGTAVFQSEISDQAAIAESSGHGRSMFRYKSRSSGAREYLALAQEIQERTAL